MSGILIYTREEARRNQYAVDTFLKNLDVKLVHEDYFDEADFVINRTNNYRISEFYESNGIRVFNPSSLSRLANDKQRCYDFMEENGIEIMPTRYTGVPAVKKAVGGHGGSQVYMINKTEKPQHGYVYQKPSSDLGKDLRVWAIGGKIITSIIRQSDTDFRSNFCLGGRATPYTLSEEETALVNKILSLVESDYIGIDFLFNDGHIVFNEIEDTVGARMVYSQTDIDILKLYCDYIKERI